MSIFKQGQTISGISAIVLGVGVGVFHFIIAEDAPVRDLAGYSADSANRHGSKRAQTMHVSTLVDEQRNLFSTVDAEISEDADPKRYESTLIRNDLRNRKNRV